MICIASTPCWFEHCHGTDIIAAIWTCMGYTVLLCFTLFKTEAFPRVSSARTRAFSFMENA